MEPAQSITARLLRPVKVLFYYGALLLFYSMVWAVNLLCLCTQKLSRGEPCELWVRGFIQKWVALYLTLLKLSGNLKLRYENFGQLANVRGTLLIGNHPCLIDAFLVLCKSPNLICVYKSALHRGLLVPATGRMSGYISNDSGRQAIRLACSKLKNGHNLLIFPEGTRTVRWPINPLTRGYALISQHANAPIRLITIETRSDALTKPRGYLRAPRLPVPYTIRLGPEISPADFPSVDALNDHIEQQFLTILSKNYEEEFCFPMQQSADDPDSWHVTLPDRLTFCRGHFPENPVLPAYATLLCVRHAIHVVKGVNPQSRTWKQLKFLRPLRPGMQLQLTLQDAGSEALKITLRSEGDVCFSGRFEAISPAHA